MTLRTQRNIALRTALQDTVPAAGKRLVIKGDLLTRTRTVCPADWPQLEDFHHRCSAASLRDFYGEAPRLTPETWAAGYEDGVLSLVTTLDALPNDAIAFTHLWRKRRREAQIALMVADAWQGRGLAAKLCRMAAELATDAGCTALHGGFAESNEGALRLVRGLRRGGRMGEVGVFVGFGIGQAQVAL